MAEQLEHTVKVMAWMQTAVLALLCNAVAQAQSPIPKEIEGWQVWVQDGQEFRHCPFFANTDGTSESNRICAWPGRLSLELNQRGGRFTQSWISYAEAWLPLPGNLEYWPNGVTVNGAVAAVVARDGIPQVRTSAGTVTIAGSFAWAKRPESLPIPAQTGLVSLNLDGHKVEHADRPDDAVWLWQRGRGGGAPQLGVQDFWPPRDGISGAMKTPLNLEE